MRKLFAGIRKNARSPASVICLPGMFPFQMSYPRWFCITNVRLSRSSWLKLLVIPARILRRRVSNRFDHTERLRFLLQFLHHSALKTPFISKIKQVLKFIAFFQSKSSKWHLVGHSATLIHIVKPEGRYYHFIQSRIEQAGCRTRKDSTRFVDTLITASPEFFKKKSPKEIQAFFQRAADFLIGRVGRENIVSAVVHMDEKTPHLHLTFVPLTKDNRLCAKEIIGNRANLSKWQDDFHAYMVEKYPDLERGESASKTGRKHIPTRLFKQAVNLSKQARAIEATLGDITPFNAGKKKEEALAMLKKWFPQMENFSGQLKKYKVTINDLLAENEKLEARAKAGEKGKMKDTMERAKLKSELDNLQRLVDRIPPDILAELKRQKRQHGKER